jgi:hypothetical protein
LPDAVEILFVPGPLVDHAVCPFLICCIDCHAAPLVISLLL